MNPIALVTDQDSLPFDFDMPLIEAAFRDRGVDIRLCNWDDHSVDWSSFRCCVLRSPWSYTRRPDAFRAWCKAASTATLLINPLDVITWSLDKRYLEDLDAAGVPTVTTRFIPAGDQAIPAVIAMSASGSDVVIKPTVGANSRQVRRFAADDLDAAIEHIELLHSQDKTAMVQPYLRAIDTIGETNLIYFGGVFSHAIRKAALLGEDGSTAKPTMDVRELRIPTEDEMAVAASAIRVAASQGGVSRLAYARVDLVRDNVGRPVVLELEVCEPSFSMPLKPQSADRFAEAVLAEVVAADPVAVDCQTTIRDDERALSLYTSNALLNELDRIDFTINGVPLPDGAVTSAGLDRDFYARTLAAEMGSSSTRLKAALAALQKGREKGRRSADSDERRYAARAGIDPNDDAAVVALWRRTWRETAENLTIRALHIIATIKGPVEAPSALDALGIDFGGK